MSRPRPELGFEFDHDGPDDGSSDGQIRIIENYIAQGVDALCVSANDPAALVDVLQEAMEEGIVVVSWDAPVNAEGRTLDVEPASAQTIALTMLESMAKSIDYEGQVAIVLRRRDHAEPEPLDQLHRGCACER